MINDILTNIQIGDEVVFVTGGRATVMGVHKVTSLYYKLQFIGFDKILGFYVDGTYFTSGSSIFDICKVCKRKKNHV